MMCCCQFKDILYAICTLGCRARYSCLYLKRGYLYSYSYSKPKYSYLYSYSLQDPSTCTRTCTRHEVRVLVLVLVLGAKVLVLVLGTLVGLLEPITAYNSGSSIANFSFSTLWLRQIS